MNTEVKPLILIVDDTPTNVQVLAESLIGDYRVKVASSGASALEIIARQGVPDLILLDVMMPGLDGYEVCRHLKNDPQTSAIPVIFVTAMNAVCDQERGLNLGALDYITKPYHLPIVKARIRNYIRLKRMTDMLEEMAWLDGLTGVPNRRRFDEALDKEWKRAWRNRLSLSIIMVDIDYFKAYNDSLGHSRGDECLKKVATSLANTIKRPCDLVARYGGEEFVILLPDTEAEGARYLAEQLRCNVEAQNIPHPHSQASIWVTVSVGYASVKPSAGMEAMALLDQADHSLYRAKEAGRNCVQG